MKYLIALTLTLLILGTAGAITVPSDDYTRETTPAELFNTTADEDDDIGGMAPIDEFLDENPGPGTAGPVTKEILRVLPELASGYDESLGDPLPIIGDACDTCWIVFNRTVYPNGTEHYDAAIEGPCDEIFGLINPEN